MATAIEYSEKIVQWMFDHGKTSYANEIRDLKSLRDETIAEAGRYWQHCEFTRKSVADIDKEIQEVYQSAVDRYEDWASD